MDFLFFLFVLLFVFSLLIFRRRSRRISELIGINKSLSEQLEKGSSEFSAEGERMAAILNSMEEGVMVTDRSGEIERVNPPLTRMLCLPDDCRGKGILECVRGPEVHLLIQRVIASGNAEEIEIKVHKLIKDKIGPDLSVVVRTGDQLQKVLEKNPFIRYDISRVFFVSCVKPPAKEKVTELLSQDFGEEEIVVIKDAANMKSSKV